jgi:hypothetical protein
MRIQIFIITMLASLSFVASAENYIVEQAYEVAVNDLRLPGHVVGTVAFKGCDKCELQTIGVTAETRYVLNNRDVTLADFAKAVNAIADKRTNIATVIHHLKSDTVVAVHVVE